MVVLLHVSGSFFNTREQLCKRHKTESLLITFFIWNYIITSALLLGDIHKALTSPDRPHTTLFYQSINQLPMGNLGIPGQTMKMTLTIWNLWCLSAGKKLASSFTFSLQYCIANLWFWVFEHTWLCIPKVILTTFRILLSLSAGKKSNSSSMFIWKYCKDMQNSFFRHTQNDSINLQKTLIFICIQKINVIIHFFFEILHFK